MRKLQITAIGEPADVLELVEFEAPAPGPGQALVEVQAATVNASDFLYISGQYFITPRPPSDVGGEGVGRVVAVGPGEDESLIGARVLLLPTYRYGTWATHLIAPTTDIVAVPNDVDTVQLAMVGINPMTALLLLQHARAAARFDAEGAVILLDDQDRSLWNQKMIAEGLALIDKAMRHRQSGPYQVQAAIAALHARAAKPEDTDWTQIDLLYGALEIMQPSPVVTLNRAVAVSKVRGAEAALEMIEPLGERLSNYFHFFGVRGAFLMQLGRNGEARVAFDRAIALANTSAEAAHIRMHLDRLMRDSAPRGAKAK